MRRRTSSTSRAGVSLVAQRGHPLEIGAHELSACAKTCWRSGASGPPTVRTARTCGGIRDTVALAQTMRMIITYTPFRPRRQAPGSRRAGARGHVKLWPQGFSATKGTEMTRYRPARRGSAPLASLRLWVGSLFHLTSAVGVQRVARHERLDLQQERQRSPAELRCTGRLPGVGEHRLSTSRRRLAVGVVRTVGTAHDEPVELA